MLLCIVAAALVLFVGGWPGMDVVGLMVLSALALTGLVTPQEALSGFSSPAVVTVWALYILSAGLTRTGIAHQLGKPLRRFADGGEAMLVVVLMVSASLLAALINTVTVAAILLPSTMELARRSGRSPSRLLMPLALGCLLGGPFTGISTTATILVTDALRHAGLRPFDIFDFTPITAAIVAAGIAFMVLAGRRLLPDRQSDSDADDRPWFRDSYQFESNILTTGIPAGSPLVGRTIAESRLGSALYLTVLAIKRDGDLLLAPHPDTVLHAGDTIIAHGSPDYLKRHHADRHILVESPGPDPELFPEVFETAWAAIPAGSPLAGSTLAASGLRKEHHVNVLSVRRPGRGEIRETATRPLKPGDSLLLQGERGALEALVRQRLVGDLTPEDGGGNGQSAGKGLLGVRIPPGSALAGHDLVEARLGNAFGLIVLGIVRDEERIVMPSPDEILREGDLLVVQGAPRDFEILQALQNLTIEKPKIDDATVLESQKICATEVMLSPRTNLAGRTLGQLYFRERYGVSVLAILRMGRALRVGLRDIPLRFGDALLVYGSRRSLESLTRDPDFLVLDEAAARVPRLEQAPAAVFIMLAVIGTAILGLAPIAIAAVAGATLMVLARCLTIEEAYRSIEWRVVFLIAGMLPLEAAIENSGAAQLGATALVDAVGAHGPRWVVAALLAVTVLATQIIPTAALVVLMAPIALGVAASLGMSPHLLLMTVATSASASFASPLSHPVHLLIMGPGGYRFIDYVKVGVPLTAISFAVAVWLLPILWPPFG
ncbi:MAG: SLC13 family permease [Acidobacteriota bacterium]